MLHVRYVKSPLTLDQWTSKMLLLNMLRFCIPGQFTSKNVGLSKLGVCDQIDNVALGFPSVTI